MQPFCSVYTKSFRWFDREPETETAKPCLYFSDLKENFLPLEDSKAIYNPERDEAVIKDLNLNRLLTTYQLAYCANGNEHISVMSFIAKQNPKPIGIFFFEKFLKGIFVGKKSIITDPDNLDADQFMVYFNNYYAKRTQPVPRPIYTGRRVFGYSRFDNYYTGKTTYQDIICREAYDYFKKDYDEGKSRLFRKKQQEKHRKKQAENQKEKKEEKPMILPPMPDSDLKMKEKICGLCCEKFGEFSSDASSREQNENKNL